jgi:hypothetical protein
VRGGNEIPKKDLKQNLSMHCNSWDKGLFKQASFQNNPSKISNLSRQPFSHSKLADNVLVLAEMYDLSASSELSSHLVFLCRNYIMKCTPFRLRFGIG